MKGLFSENSDIGTSNPYGQSNGIMIRR